MMITASKLRAQWGKFMRRVRSGEEITITDRERPVAKLVPFEADEDDDLQIQEPAEPFTAASFKTIKPIAYSATDSLAML